MKIAVGMSGGVDSSVSALLLKEMGHDVIGIFMKNWDEDDKECPAIQDYEDALSVCQKLDIPLYSFNFSNEYWDAVFVNFLDDLKKGFTPNPDIFCNKEIKFNVLLQKALELGAEKLATGHYAQISPEFELLKGRDKNKDQSYFLYTLTSDILKKALFPVGAYQKEEIRKLAEKNGLVTYNKKDSTGICFIGKRKFKDFITTYMPPTKGTFQTPDGKIIGEHTGAWFYTIGQRKGMGIGGAGDAWFVVDKDIDNQTVIVAQGENHPLLYSDSLIATDLSFVKDLPSTPLQCTAKIRYRQEDEPCIIEKIESGRAQIKFLHPQRAITPRQAIVFYQDNICLGGGLIHKKGCI
ncbi:MAG: tRNA 2-thiouridine(34) synthase MnmA [Chlamydiae bacterium]|nr:tRNA 2-thiouridine(34) synthase MnmA [Chlamydiota bacterium]